MATFSSTGTTRRRTTPAISLRQALDAMFNPRNAPRGPVGGQAFYNAQLRYQPVLDAMLLQRKQNVRQYERGREAAAFAGAAAQTGIEGIRDRYTQSVAPLAQVAADAGPEQQRAAAQMGLTGQGVAGMLSTLAAAQKEGIGTQQQALRTKYMDDQGDLNDQIRSTIGQYAAFKQQQYGEGVAGKAAARADAADKSADRAISLIKSHINPDTGVYDPALDRPATPGSAGSSRASKDNRDTFRKGGLLARSYADLLKVPRRVDGKVVRLNGKQIIDALISGTPSGSAGRVPLQHLDPKTHKLVNETDARGNVKYAEGPKVPGMKAIEDPLAAKAGAEVALYGGISSKTAIKLHNAGYTAHDLGVPIIPQKQFDKMVRERYHPRSTSAAAAIRASKNFGLGR